MSEGILLDLDSSRLRFDGCVTVCDFLGCSDITTRFYVRGEDPAFWDMYERSQWSKDEWYQDRIFILGFCESHGSMPM